ncbi:TetR/AcrR family transcriptional regulator [Pseudonocardia sp.]|uniref:TetR/AcrR family transcriptional regulator n=1 Tax=Pseudonocardia sp. TaxID=60912 RepID=UPI003D12A69D
MAGKRQFDEQQVLDRVTELFRHRGYAATSIDDLVRETGLSRGSLYSTFGGKAELFALVLERYRAYMMGTLQERMTGDEPREAVRSLLVGLLDTLALSGRPGGCLVTNTVAEADDTPTEIMASARTGLAQQEAQLSEYLHAAKAAEMLPADADPLRLARYFVGIRQAVGVLWRAGVDREQIVATIDVSVSVLDR